jgi:mRNA-degrading endonuclease RelE of RelBE toxin-antitoxin system
VNYKIIVTPKFSRQIKHLKKKYKKIREDFARCIELLEKDPLESRVGACKGANAGAVDAGCLVLRDISAALVGQLW